MIGNIEKNTLPNDLAYSTSLSYSACSYVAGGYCKVGNLVIVNLRVKYTGTTGAGKLMQIGGFPTYSNKTVNAKNIVPLTVYDFTSEKNVIDYAAINAAGDCVCQGTFTANDEHSIHAAYLCD